VHKTAKHCAQPCKNPAGDSDPILSQMNPAHNLTTYLVTYHSNIIICLRVSHFNTKVRREELCVWYSRVPVVFSKSKTSPLAYRYLLYIDIYLIQFFSRTPQVVDVCQTTCWVRLKNCIKRTLVFACSVLDRIPAVLLRRSQNLSHRQTVLTCSRFSSVVHASVPTVRSRPLSPTYLLVYYSTLISYASNKVVK
jgi:hypothetical protein